MEEFVIIFKIYDKEKMFDLSGFRRAFLFKGFQISEAKEFLQRKDILKTLEENTYMFSSNEVLEIAEYYTKEKFIEIVEKAGKGEFETTEILLLYWVINGQFIKEDGGSIFFLEKNVSLGSIMDYTTVEVFDSIKHQPQITTDDLVHLMIGVNNMGAHNGTMLYAIDSAYNLADNLKYCKNRRIIILIHDLKMSQILYIFRELYPLRKQYVFRYYLETENDRLYEMEVKENEIVLKDPDITCLKLV